MLAAASLLVLDCTLIGTGDARELKAIGITKMRELTPGEDATNEIDPNDSSESEDDPMGGSGHASYH